MKQYRTGVHRQKEFLLTDVASPQILQAWPVSFDTMGSNFYFHFVEKLHFNTTVKLIFYLHAASSLASFNILSFPKKTRVPD